jgi:hypothetical protein
MRPTYDKSAPAAAILTLAEIKAATEAFDRGESNVLDTLDAIIAAVEGYQHAVASRSDAA